ncbi:Cytochrome b-c1 complex, subunit [Musa troglodytarum]|uniref:Cytochrome b-c1 complex, subunit n=1 Tax=Musa troglodytarum TaxID=320322 RepID=A0A9E7GCW0_9LILI|nr:Cytochrome b-c1 complex, subunit [Musa troglodytarum]
MDSTAVRRGRGGGVWEGLYRLLMRRNSVYVTFVVAGAFVGERSCDLVRSVSFVSFSFEVGFMQRGYFSSAHPPTAAVELRGRKAHSRVYL